MLFADKSACDGAPAEGRGRCPDFLSEQSRIDRLVQFADHCSSAKELAESMGDTFLAYMMSMSILAARSEMRPKIPR